MPIILNLKTREYFIATDEQEQHFYLKKLLNHRTPTLSFDWIYISYKYKSFKTVIRWERTDKIIIVPSEIESYILNTKNNYKQISINLSRNVQF